LSPKDTIFHTFINQITPQDQDQVIQNWKGQSRSIPKFQQKHFTEWINPFLGFACKMIDLRDKDRQKKIQCVSTPNTTPATVDQYNQSINQSTKRTIKSINQSMDSMR
jgi:hypothetical protein